MPRPVAPVPPVPEHGVSGSRPLSFRHAQSERNSPAFVHLHRFPGYPIGMFSAGCGRGQGVSLEQLRDRLHHQANTLSAPLTRMLARAGATPDLVTVAGLVLSAVAALCLAGGALRTAGVIWLVGSALDLLDGALARHNGMVARKGAFLDSTLDRISEGLLLTAAVYHFALQGMEPAAAVCAYALLVSFMVSYTRARAEALGVSCKSGLATRAERVALLGLGLVFNALFIAVTILAILATITTFQRLVHVRAVLSAMDRGGAVPGTEQE